ncbi:MAG: hypothetical protein KTR14_07675 [Vampirovibrio sp.]|nr:hypothetical protein [Vampirovibrio sp.]
MVASSVQCAEAGWLFWKKDKKQEPAEQTYERPALDAQETQCEPLRLKIISLNQNPLLKTANAPRVKRLKKKYYQCVRALKDQQREFLLHADVKPSKKVDLPPLKVVPEEQ